MSLIALDPKEVFELTVEGAVFTCRYLTARQSAEFDRLTDAATLPVDRLTEIQAQQKELRARLAERAALPESASAEIVKQLEALAAEVKRIVPSTQRELELLLQALALGEVRLRPNDPMNAAGPITDLSQIMTIHQLWDLANQVQQTQRISEKQRKKSALQSASAAAATSAGSAGTGV